MNLESCVVSSDEKPLYLDFYPIIRETWQRLLGIRCFLFLIGNEVPVPFRSFAQDIILVPPIAGVKTGFHAQAIRLLAPQLIGGTGAILLSDIDMLPMRASYFTKALDGVDSDALVIYREDDRHLARNEVAICYNAATARTWRELIEPVHDVSEANDLIRRWYAAFEYDGAPGKVGWSEDQRLLHAFVSAFDIRRIVRCKDRQLSFARLDRPRIGKMLRLNQVITAAGGGYADYHMKRPFKEFQTLNEQIARLARRDMTLSPLAQRVLTARRVEKIVDFAYKAVGL